MVYSSLRLTEGVKLAGISQASIRFSKHENQRRNRGLSATLQKHLDPIKRENCEEWKRFSLEAFDVAYVTENICNQFIIKLNKFDIDEYTNTYNNLFKKPLERKMFLFEQPVDILKDVVGQYMVLGMFLFPGAVTPYVIGTVAYPADLWESWKKVDPKYLSIVGCSNVAPNVANSQFDYLFKEQFVGDETRTHTTLEYWLSNLIFMNALVMFMNQEAKRAVVDTNFVPIEKIKPKFRSTYDQRPKKLISVIYRRKYETLPSNLSMTEAKSPLYQITPEEKKAASIVVKKAMKRHTVTGHYRNVYYPTLGKHMRKWIDDYKRGYEAPTDQPTPKIVLLCR